MHTMLRRALQRRILLTKHPVVFGRSLGILPGPSSQVFEERKTLGWKCDEVFDVVADVGTYKDFLPWCVGSRVLNDLSRRDSDCFDAELRIGFQGLDVCYISRVSTDRPRSVHSQVVDSDLFHHLDSVWELRHGRRPGTTDITFRIEFAFRSPLYQSFASIFLDEVCGAMVAAFENRCRQRYGCEEEVRE